jgi:UDP-N-acetylmuramate--alanine ligase
LHSYFSVINNMESDHLDCYKDMHEIQQAFTQFANQTSVFGAVLANGDDKNVGAILPEIQRRKITYGQSKGVDIRASNIQTTPGGIAFDVFLKEQRLGRIRLNLYGRHNVNNALACVGLGLELGIDFKTIAQSLEQFHGTARRFENIGVVNGVTIIDDYAHHPTEIRATLKGAREAWPDQRIIVLFQPHLFSRTRDYFTEFAQAFSDADVVLVTEIYPAREEPVPGVTGAKLAEAMKKYSPAVHYVPEKEYLLKKLLEIAKPGDVAITMGAGDITEIGRSAVLIKQA